MTNYSRARDFLACAFFLSVFCPASVRGQEVDLAWGPSPSPSVVGYAVFYGLASGDYSSNLDAGTDLEAAVTGLAPGVTYYFATASYDTNGDYSQFSNEVTNRLPLPPAITSQPVAQTVAIGASATLTVSVVGDPPLNFQWMDGRTAVAGATASSLSWSQVAAKNAGTYTVVVTNPWGSVTGTPAVVAALNPPWITKQPISQTVHIGAAVSLSATAGGSTPLSFQWYDGNTPLAGATGSNLTWNSVAAANAGNYRVVVSNAVGTVQSSIATLTVQSSGAFAQFAGAYNGLFFQTNRNGSSDVTQATAGFLNNCVVTSNGAFSAKLFVAGKSYSLSDSFNGAGNDTISVLSSGGIPSGLQAFLQLGLSNGMPLIVGAISNTVAGNPWNAPLVAYVATNAFPALTAVALTLSPGSSSNAPTASGAAAGAIVNGVMTLAGTLGDTSIFSQTVPISGNGDVPIYVSLYNNSGLLEGWITLGGGAVTGTLTWIRPSGVLLPLGFLAGFNTEVNVTGTTTGN